MSNSAHCKRKLSISSSSEPSPVSYQVSKKHREQSVNMNSSASGSVGNQFGEQGQSFAMGPMGPMGMGPVHPQHGPMNGPMQYGGPWTSTPQPVHPPPPPSLLSDNDIHRIAIAVKSIMFSEIDQLVENKVDAKYKTIVQCCNQLAAQNKLLQNRIDDLEMYSRRSCIRIFGVPENNFDKANTDEAILEIAEKIEVPLKAGDIAVSHRVGKIPEEDNDPTKPKPKPRPIIARITNYNLRHRLIKECRNLPKVKDIRDDMKNVFINQDLTKTRNKLAYEARQMVKSENAKATFTWDGKIFVVDNDDVKHKITCLDDLINLKVTLGLIPEYGINDDGSTLDPRLFTI